MGDAPKRIEDLPDLATPLEVAAVMRCSSRFVQDECKAGRLNATLVAGRYLIAPDDVRAYLTDRRTCRNETKARTSTSTTAGRSGTSGGSKMAKHGSAQRALETVAELRASLRGTSPARAQAQVIPLPGPSRTS
ncbi:helix-turn-helix domain-containing protein [Azospirillum sp. A1-3]|uniref:helix-turn-helix domain-containing protein n=1 Tax=Azospirillum sp. A1-3 TaxID=185874 RepID=UPI0020772193|nr:helix-turn-helix domain-containing protein [Azospirillum sp. A1-3]MCM8734629.1 helix-turn-helix domain-containing protein [Azospirillum sp. A1-3]